MKIIVKPLLTVVLAVGGNGLQESRSAGVQSTNRFNPAIPQADAWGLSEPGSREVAPNHQSKEGTSDSFPTHIKLTGFAQVGGAKRVFFALPDKGESERVRHLSLGEGQHAMGIQVIDIHPQVEEVRIEYEGHAWTLNLKQHGYQVTGKATRIR